MSVSSGCSSQSSSSSFSIENDDSSEEDDSSIEVTTKQSTKPPTKQPSNTRSKVKSTRDVAAEPHPVNKETDKSYYLLMTEEVAEWDPGGDLPIDQWDNDQIILGATSVDTFEEVDQPVSSKEEVSTGDLEQEPKTIIRDNNGYRVISRFEFHQDKTVTLEYIRALFGPEGNQVSTDILNERLNYVRLLKKSTSEFMTTYVNNEMSENWAKLDDHYKEDYRAAADYFSVLNPATEGNEMTRMLKKFFEILTRGKGFPKKWELEAEKVFMERFKFVYKEQNPLQGKKRLAKGCISKMASRVLINARRKVWAPSKKDDRHGCTVSTKSEKGKGITDLTPYEQ